MKNRKLLFVMGNLNAGGAEKALVSMLRALDYSRYEVHLFLFRHEGIFLHQLPSQVKLLEEPNNYRYFEIPLRAGILRLLYQFKFKVLWQRIMFALVFRKDYSPSIKEQKGWKYVSPLLPCLMGYDVAIGYLQRSPIYFCIDNTDAPKKIGFIHNDYRKLHMDEDIDKRYLVQLDYIFSVSASCVEVLKQVFPNLRNKVRLMHNIIDVESLLKQSECPAEIRKAPLIIVSVGRLHRQKGFDMAIDACKILVDRGLDLVWYVLGDGGERTMLEQHAASSGVEDRFLLPGITENPYPIIRAADIYVQPSRFEGKSIAIDEAKILCKPIIVTEFPSVVDQITHMVTGYIVPFDPFELADAICMLATNPELANRFRANLSAANSVGSAEMQRLYEVID